MHYKKTNQLIGLIPFYSTVRLVIIGVIVIFAAGTAAALNTHPPAKRVIVIDKAKKHLVLFRNGKETAEFPASFGIDPDSDKYKAFDCATPEGRFFLTFKKNNSPFHRFLGISYPNLANAEKGLAAGEITKMEYGRIVDATRKSGWTSCGTGLGCDIGIHGGGVFRTMDHSRERDWTEGCIALNDSDIEKLYALCRPGDPVIIFNSRRNLYGIIRPFTHAVDVDREGIPVCSGGCCEYQVELATSMGQVAIKLKEGKNYGRSMEVSLYATDDAREKPVLVLVDRNADGYISSLDSVSGSAGGDKHPEDIYQQLRKAVIDSLSRGDIAAGRARN